MNEKVLNALQRLNVEYEEYIFETPFETTLHSAEMLHTDMEHIAKTMVFKAPFGVIVVIASGAAKVDNKKFKNRFEVRPAMLKADELLVLTGFEPGSVSPIGIASEKLQVYMDSSLLAFCGETVFPSGGTDRCAIGITPEDLYKAAECHGRIDVCK